MAPPPCAHDRDDVAAAQEHALEIVVDLLVEIRFRHLRHAACGRAADIVDQNVDAAELFAARLRRLGDLPVIEHVTDMSGDLAVIADACDGLGHRLGCFVDGEDFGALASKQHRGGTAIAPARTDTTSPGNERDFAFYSALDSSCHAPSPLCERADVRA
jgi:hypothetical protein